MKVEARVLDVTSTLEGEKVGMTIDEGALAHIMSVLTDLYSDPELAVIREYSTNAFDAHVEADVSRPIEVWTPTPLSMFFKVRDYGDGLNVDDIRDIYSRYGASTKRESNDVVGMLGLGCKSALTYTDQFTVTGWKNGICTQVSVSRDEDGSGSMTIVAEYESDEPSGVEITVPAKRGNYFANKAMDFFRFWNEGTVLVDGKQPKRISGLMLTDDLMLSEELEQDVVVMGNVAYPFGEQHYRNYSTVAFVNIGDVAFTPSRESLQMTKKTKDKISEIRSRVAAEREKAVQRNIDAASNHVEALKVFLAASRMDYKGTPTYKGQVIPTMFKIAKQKTAVNPDKTTRTYDYDEQFITVKKQKHYGDKGWYREHRVYMSAVTTNQAVFLVGYDGADFTPTKRKKLLQWTNEKGITAETFILVPEIPAEYTIWIDPTLIHPWEEVKAQKIVREGQTRRDGRPSGSYEGCVNGVHQQVIKAEDIDTSNPIYYVNRTHDHRHWQYVSFLNTTGKKYTYILLPGNRVAKFQRDFPNAISATTAVADIIKTWKDNLTQEQIDLLVVGDDYYRRNDLAMLRKLDDSLVDDPEVKRAIQMASNQLNVKLKGEYDSLFKGHLNLKSTWQSPLKKYVLLTGSNIYGTMNDKLKQEVYIYLNAVYAAGKAGN